MFLKIHKLRRGDLIVLLGVLRIKSCSLPRDFTIRKLFWILISRLTRIREKKCNDVNIRKLANLCDLTKGELFGNTTKITTQTRKFDDAQEMLRLLRQECIRSKSIHNVEDRELSM